MKRLICAAAVVAAMGSFIIGAALPASAAVLVNYTPAQVCVRHGNAPTRACLTTKAVRC